MAAQQALLSKPHYEILDGLRGVASLIVVTFHLFEIHATSAMDQIINHGYIAVDFFFLLSGFVIGYAYDDRWKTMTIGNFFKRRLIRLQPMVVLGGLIGGLCFYFGESAMFPLIAQTSVWKLLLVTCLGCLLLPIPPSMDVRVWNEMYPLNGPAWSLFFEYIANILYGLIVRRFSKLLLAIFVAIAGLGLIKLTIFDGNGSVIGGHILDGSNFLIGMTRLLFPFFAGVLLFRIGKFIKVKGGFLVSSLILAVILMVPRIGGADAVWMNGLYECLSIMLVFPIIVLIGAGSSIKGKRAIQICDFLGKISFPLYIIHYPIVYLYMAYATENKLSWTQTWPIMAAILLGCVALAYACLRFFDEPVRRWLQRRFMATK